jgi:quercetin dioxygenase-like cupin family protein
LSETVIRGEEAPRFEAPGTDVVGYASPSRGSATISAWRVTLHPGAASPLHSLTSDEAFLVVSGRCTFEVHERRHVLGAGDAICVPPDVTFRLLNESDEPFEAVACMAAGGMGRVGDGEPFVPPWAA